MIPGVRLRRVLILGTKYPSIVAVGNIPLPELQALKGIGLKLAKKVSDAINQESFRD
jgi:hypothetical protein